MQKISSNKLISNVTTLFTLLLLAKLISLVVWWFLPSEGISLNAKKSYQATYQRVDFKNMLARAQVKKSTTTAQAQTNNTSAYSINSLILKGLYGNQTHGFAIVAKKSAVKKTTIVSIGEVYAGYKLKEILLDKVIFTKSGKEYVLKLASSSKSDLSKSVTRVKQQNSADMNEHSVSKQDINFYSKDPSRIWKDIAIDPVKKNGKIEGFRVRRIKPNSKMAELGLKKGDIIIKANNIRLSSFRDAIKLYKNIDKINTIELVVLRNNQEKEIIYEIH